MPARRKRKRTNSKKTKPKKKYLYIAILFLILIFCLAYFLRIRQWNNKEKLFLLINNDDSMIVAVADPTTGDMYRINIPGNTEVEVAGDLGRWKVKTLWVLGKQEKLGGKLAARSITMGLGLPVYAWADKKALGLIDISLKNSFTALFSSYDSNFSFGDRLNLFLFSIKTKNTKKVTIDLGETGFLEKDVLSDGNEGYRVSKTSPQNILAIFSEPSYSDGVVRVSMIDGTDEVGKSEKVSAVVQALGGKVSSVVNSLGFEGKCRISSKDKKLLDVLLRIFECEEYTIKEDQSFDVEISLGSEFTKVY